MPRSVVAVNAQGRVTLPADVRRKLGISDGDQLEVKLEDDHITLRPARVVVAEDAWAYTAESLTGIRRALDDIKEGRVYRLSWQELDGMVEAGEVPSRLRRARGGKST